MGTIRELLMARRRELEQMIGPAVSELEEIDRAMAAIGDRSPQPLPTTQRVARYRPPLTTIPDQLLAILGASGRLPTSKIADRIREDFGREINNKNVSWHLSKLKREGRVVLENELWAIAAQKDESPTEEAAEPSLV